MQIVSKAIKDENQETRDVQDGKTWEQIDRIKDLNKDELARIIEAGMDHKQKLN